MIHTPFSTDSRWSRSTLRSGILVFTFVACALCVLLLSNIEVQPPRGRNAEGKSLVAASTLATSASRLAARTSRCPVDTPETTLAANTAPPRIIVGQTTHDFGRMDPLASGRHIFTIHNEGRGPLRLLDHRSTCSCTVGEFTRSPIATGESTQVVVKWKTPSNAERFEQSAVIETNDPELPQVRFTITGTVLIHAGADPGELGFPAVRPGQPSTATTVVSSQVWPDFELRNIRSSIDGLAWTVEEPEEEEREHRHWLAARRLTVTLPNSLPPGDFTHWLRFQLVPNDPAAAPVECELPIHGKVLKRIAVYGQGIDAWGNLRLGIVTAERGLKRRLFLKVYDLEPALRVKEIAAHPRFLRAAITPYDQRRGGATARAAEAASEDRIGRAGPHPDAALGLYHLDLEIPAGSPPCFHQDQEAGTIILRFDHPRIDELRLRTHFAVSARLADANE